MDSVRSRFISATDKFAMGAPIVLATAVKLPTGAVELITNTQFIPEKIQYLRDAYDDDFRLKNNPNIQIVGYMLV